MTLDDHSESQSIDLLLPVLFFFGRLILFLGLIPNNFYGFGDFPAFFKWSSLPGWPYLHYWVEFPPLVPFLTAGINKLAGGQEFLFDFMLLALVSLAGSGCLYVFMRIARRLYGEKGALIRTLMFFALLAPLPYTWWYFDLIPVFLTLIALDALLLRKEASSGTFIAMGMLAKWFPALLLPAVFRTWPLKKVLRTAALAIAGTGLVIGALYVASPAMTSASLRTQLGRTSWETVWALVDGNYTTGEFILLPERTAPAQTGLHNGNPARIPPLLTLAVFGLLGLWLFWKSDLSDERAFISFVGITWVIFFAWMPGWSPQWILYLLPLILLTLPWEKGMLWATLLMLVTIVEWPVLLARHLWAGLWLVAPARMVVFGVLSFLWFKQIYTNLENVKGTVVEHN
jgi:hypothetical protein